MPTLPSAPPPECPALRERVAATRPEYLDDLDWLADQRDRGAFITVPEYRRQVLGPVADEVQFRDKEEIVAAGDWDALLLNFLDKVDATNRTARALTKCGLSFIAARNLHHDLLDKVARAYR